MKAIVQDRYGSPADVLELREIDIPVVGAREVLVRVSAASVHPDIWHVVTGRPLALRFLSAGAFKPKPPVPGTDVAGLVESVGEDVVRFRRGDEVYGEIVHGNSWRHGGAYAEYVSVPEDSLALKPAHLTFEQAAALPTSGIIALRSLLAGRQMKPGKSVLINGAGGNVGALAVQIARAYDAQVTGVDCTEKLGLMRSMGAHHVIDYAQRDFTLGPERYDFILDVASNLSFSDCKRVLTPTGTYILVGHDQFGGAGRWFGSMPRFFGQAVRSHFDRHLATPNFSIRSGALMATLRTLIEGGKIKPVVDRTFPLSEAANAIRYLQDGRARGTVVVTI